jgi:hypothetical protein
VTRKRKTPPRMRYAAGLLSLVVSGCFFGLEGNTFGGSVFR